MSYSTLEQIKIRLNEYDVKNVDGEVQIIFKDTPALDVKIEYLIEKAKADIIFARHYPDNFTQDMIDEDIYAKYHHILLDLVLYDYSIEGMDFESNHSENGVNRTYVKRETITGKVIPFCRVL